MHPAIPPPGLLDCPQDRSRWRWREGSSPLPPPTANSAWGGCPTVGFSGPPGGPRALVPIPSQPNPPCMLLGEAQAWDPGAHSAPRCLPTCPAQGDGHQRLDCEACPGFQPRHPHESARSRKLACQPHSQAGQGAHRARPAFLSLATEPRDVMGQAGRLQPLTELHWGDSARSRAGALPPAQAVGCWGAPGLRGHLAGQPRGQAVGGAAAPGHCFWPMENRQPVPGTAHPQLVSSRLSPTCSDAMPKSATLMLFFSSSRRFSGFRSRWLGRKAGLRLTGVGAAAPPETLPSQHEANGSAAW